ncbi:MAG TPA: hypothetical protein VJY84_01605 [Candidatus Saccharimonadales bacterium]|nr:hypothetical protein [Candidatus Saccharimonadales bacterium]
MARELGRLGPWQFPFDVPSEDYRELGILSEIIDEAECTLDWYGGKRGDGTEYHALVLDLNEKIALAPESSAARSVREERNRLKEMFNLPLKGLPDVHRKPLDWKVMVAHERTRRATRLVDAIAASLDARFPADQEKARVLSNDATAETNITRIKDS